MVMDDNRRRMNAYLLSTKTVFGTAIKLRIMPWLSKQPLIYRLFLAMNAVPDIIFGEMQGRMVGMLRIVVKIPQFVKILCPKD